MYDFAEVSCDSAPPAGHPAAWIDRSAGCKVTYSKEQVYAGWKACFCVWKLTSILGWSSVIFFGNRGWESDHQKYMKNLTWTGAVGCVRGPRGTALPQSLAFCDPGQVSTSTNPLLHFLLPPILKYYDSNVYLIDISSLKGLIIELMIPDTLS